MGLDIARITYVDDTGEHRLLDNPLKRVNGLWIKCDMNDSRKIIKSCDYWEVVDTTASFAEISGHRIRYRETFLQYDPLRNIPLSLNICVYFPKQPFFIIDYTIKNTSKNSSLADVSLYWLIDLDIEGKESYKDNFARYDDDIVYQYHSRSNVHAGFCSTIKSSRYECNSPYALRIKSHHLNLGNINSRGPDDCSIGLQWDFGQLSPQKTINLPVVFAAGMDKTHFHSNMEQGIALLNKIKNTNDPTS